MLKVQSSLQAMNHEARNLQSCLMEGITMCLLNIWNN